MSKQPLVERGALFRNPVPKKKLILTFLLLALLAVAGCSGRPAPATEQVEPSATSSHTSPPLASASTPTPIPVVPTAPKPTATFVPLITPSPTPEGGSLTKTQVPRVSVGVAKEMADAGEAVLVDVRPKGTFGIAHIAGAISLPLEEVPDRIGELPTDRLVIFYCA